MSNRKNLVLFGAFFPQFIDPKGDYGAQVVLLGVTARWWRRCSKAAGNDLATAKLFAS